MARKTFRDPWLVPSLDGIGPVGSGNQSKAAGAEEGAILTHPHNRPRR
jgi:hypothetical protein